MVTIIKKLSVKNCRAFQNFSMKTCNTGLFRPFLLTFQEITYWAPKDLQRSAQFFQCLKTKNKWKCYQWWLTQGDKGHPSPPFLKWLYKFLLTIFWFIMTISKLYSSKSIYFYIISIYLLTRLPTYWLFD